MANTNTRQVQFRDRDLTAGARLPTDMPDVIRPNGEDTASVAQISGRTWLTP